MAFCKRLDLDLPDTFPLRAWDDFFAAGVKLTDKDDVTCREFKLAAVAVAHRYRACDEARASMCAAWDRCGGRLHSEDLYAQQRDLFVFFTAGVAAVESACYACYVMATRRAPTVFSFSEKERSKTFTSDPQFFSETIAKAPPGHGLTGVANVADALQKSAEWKTWKAFRNLLVHRTLPPHHARASFGATEPPRKLLSYVATWSTEEIWAEADYLENKLGWLASQLEQLMCEGARL